jgi:DNA (cytosine-5)-methyltransferase 1
MAISYKKLWKRCIDKEINKTELRELAKVSPASIAKLSKGEPVNMETLLKICNVLNCSIADIIDSTPDGTEFAKELTDFESKTYPPYDFQHEED